MKRFSVPDSLPPSFSTGSKHRGRIDTLGLDQDGSPVIIDHRGDFEVAARSRLGADTEVAWDQPRLILLAEGFNRYDHYAVNRIDGRIELWTYTFYEDDFLRVERVETQEPSGSGVAQPKTPPTKSSPPVKYTTEHHLAKMSDESKELFETLREQILALGNDVNERFMNQYIGYRRQKNFVEIVGQKKGLNVFIDGPLKDMDGLGEDASKIGHWGTGDLRIQVDSDTDLDKLFGLIKQAYELQQ